MIVFQTNITLEYKIRSSRSIWLLSYLVPLYRSQIKHVDTQGCVECLGTFDNITNYTSILTAHVEGHEDMQNMPSKIAEIFDFLNIREHNSIICGAFAYIRLSHCKR